MGTTELLWGRKTKATWDTALGSLVLVLICPVWIIFNWVTLEYFDGSLHNALSALASDGLLSFLESYAPRPSLESFVGYAVWVVFQAALYSALPGPISTGQLTPAGNLLEYKTNGLLAWIVTHVFVVVAALCGFLDLAIIANHWEGLLIVTNIYGFLLSVFCQIKAHVAPSHPKDRKFSGQTGLFALG